MGVAKLSLVLYPSNFLLNFTIGDWNAVLYRRGIEVNGVTIRHSGVVVNPLTSKGALKRLTGSGFVTVITLVWFF